MAPFRCNLDRGADVCLIARPETHQSNLPAFANIDARDQRTLLRRTYLFPIQAGNWMNNISPNVRRNLQLARSCFFWLFVVNISIYIACVITFQRYALIFLITGFAFQILSYSVTDFLGDPINKQRSPIESLDL
jgi:hypothetical protein